MIHDLKGIAHRFNGTIGVYLMGNLADTCHEAEVVDHYPGGHIVYIVDPGAAQVFVELRSRPSPFCLDVLVPWSVSQTIVDTEHDKVEVFVNRNRRLTLPIIEIPDPAIFQGSGGLGALFLAREGSSAAPDVAMQWIVIQLIDGTRCSVIPESALYPQIYRQVFGPASYAACTAWANENCKND